MGINNDKGVVGIAPSVQVYTLKVTNSNGITSCSTVAKAVDWAITNKFKY